MADFITKCSYEEQAVEEGKIEWKLYIDGTTSKGTKIVLKRPYGVVIEYVLRLAFKVTNNMVEYRTLSNGLDLAREMKPKKLSVYSNSQMVIGQVNG